MEANAVRKAKTAAAADAVPAIPIIEPFENLMEKHRGISAVFFFCSKYAIMLIKEVIPCRI